MSHSLASWDATCSQSFSHSIKAGLDCGERGRGGKSSQVTHARVSTEEMCLLSGQWEQERIIYWAARWDLSWIGFWMGWDGTIVTMA
ncbi:hypothetical protein DL95DRAFT_378070, partial [Leptodontidium sp. 2 PMI_412]